MKEALKLALEALQKTQSEGYNLPATAISEAITAIKTALAQQDGQSNFCAQCEAFARELRAVKQEQVKPAHVISEQDQLKQWIETTNYFRAKREYEPDAAQPAQEPVAWMTPDGEGFRIRFSPPTNDVPLGWDALYTTPQQRTEERNFCQRCGKRTADLTVIHTCTPPQENT
jgi:hypothetical protein